MKSLLILPVLSIVSITLGSPILTSNSRTETIDGRIAIMNQTETEKGGYTVDGRWTALDTPGDFSCGVWAISADGSKIAGTLWSWDQKPWKYSEMYGCLWNLEGWNENVPIYSFNVLMPLDGYAGSRINNMSDSGNYIIGQSMTALSAYQTQACYWDAYGNAFSLGQLHYESYVLGESWSYSVSNNGVIVGTTVGSELGYQLAFLWDEINGMQYAKDVLEDIGYDFGEATLTEAFYINPEGTYISGSGYDADGNFILWEAVIPEPATVALLGVGGLMLRKRKR